MLRKGGAGGGRKGGKNHGVRTVGSASTRVVRRASGGEAAGRRGGGAVAANARRPFWSSGWYQHRRGRHTVTTRSGRAGGGCRSAVLRGPEPRRPRAGSRVAAFWNGSCARAAGRRPATRRRTMPAQPGPHEHSPPRACFPRNASVRPAKPADSINRPHRRSDAGARRTKHSSGTDPRDRAPLPPHHRQPQEGPRCPRRS